MKHAEFEAWYSANIETMKALGIMHPNSAWGRTAKIALAVQLARVDVLEARVSALEAKPKRAARKKESNG